MPLSFPKSSVFLRGGSADLADPRQFAAEVVGGAPPDLPGKDEFAGFNLTDSSTKTSSNTDTISKKKQLKHGELKSVWSFWK